MNEIITTDTPEPVITPTFAELLAQLKEARDTAAYNKTKRDERLKDLQNDTDYVIYSETYAISNASAEKLEARIKTMAAYGYMQGGPKNPAEGVEGKDFKTFTIENKDSVHLWCMSNYPAALLVDPKHEEVRKLIISQLPATLIIDEGQVKTYAAKIGAVPGVKQGVEVRFQIASKL